MDENHPNMVFCSRGNQLTSNVIHKDNFLSYFLALIILILLSIWAIPHTIALRNFLLGLGFLAGSIVIWKEKEFLSWRQSLSVLFILGFFIWLIIHFYFFSWDPSAQLKELTSTWLRALFGGVIAFSCALLLPQKPVLKLALILGTFTPILFYLISLIYEVALRNEVAYLGFTGIVGHKIVIGYLGIIYIAIVYGAFLNVINKSVSSVEVNLIHWSLMFIGIIFVITSFVLIDSKNGIGSFVILTTLYGLVVLITLLRLKKYYILIRILIVLIPLCIVPIKVHLSNNNVWATFLADVKIGTQVTKYDHWHDRSNGYPLNEFGSKVSATTYERVAWGISGIKFAAQNPLGTGVLADSFKRVASKNGIVSSSLQFTHSGWIDLTLAVGVPGLTLIMCSFMSSFFTGLKNKNVLGSVTVWTLMAVILFWGIAELANNKHFIEMLVFLLVMFGTCNTYDKSSNNSKI